jgi:hypothetical protein
MDRINEESRHCLTNLEKHRRYWAIGFLFCLDGMAIATLSCGGGGGSSAAPPPPVVSVTISPESASPILGTTQQFSATVTGPSNSSVTWSVNNVSGGNTAVGTINSSGLYTAPQDLPNPATVTVTATSQADTSKSAGAQVTITSDIQVSVQTSPAASAVYTGATLQLTATVSSKGSPDETVTWSVDGIPNGNATVGTITTTGTDTATYTAPTAVPSPANITIQATSVADSSKSAKAQLTVTQGLAITSVSSSSPTALTPLYVSTAGFDPSQPFSISLFNSSGYSATLTPLRTEGNGTVVLAMPLYIDPTSGNTSSLNASLTISQGSQTSSPVALTIQDIPQNSDYGTSLGQITEAFYDYQQISMGAMLNGLQAIQAIPGNAVDTTAAQAHVSTQLMNAILARSDIDQIVLSYSTQVGAGILPDGTSISFNSSSIEMMDRLIGTYLTAIQPAISSAAQAMEEHRLHSRATRAANVIRISDRTGRFSHRPGVRDASPLFGAMSGPSARRGFRRAQSIATPDGIASVLPILSVVDAGETIASALRTDWSSDSTVGDRLIASEAGAYAGLLIYGTAAAALGVAGAPAIVAAATTAGAVIALAAIANDIYKVATNPNNILTGSASGQSGSALATAISAIDSPEGTLVLDSVKMILGNLPDAVPAAKFLQNEGSQVGIEGANLLISTLQLYAQNASSDQTTVQDAAAQFATPFPSPLEGFAYITGSVNVPTNEGAGAPLSGIQLSSDLSDVFTTIADPSGNYDIFVPLKDPWFDYVNADVTIVDPISQTNLGSETVDLSSLTTGAPLQIPTLQGSPCNNIDFDSDDPDCD